MANNKREKEITTIRDEDEFGEFINRVTEFAIIMVDPFGFIQRWNEEAKRIKGYESHEVIGKYISLLYTPEDIESGLVERDLENAKRGGSYESENWRVRKDGTRFWANVVLTGIYSDAHSFLGYVGVTRDITDLRNACEDLSAIIHQKAKASTIFIDRITDAFIAFDIHWNFTFLNERASNLLGLKPNELLGKNLWETFPELKESRFYEPFWETMENHKTMQVEDFYPPLQSWFRASLYSHQDGLSVFLQDITSRKKIEAAYHETFEKYRQIVETANEGIWMVDLNNKTVFVNQKLCDILSYRVDEMMGKDLFDFLAEDEKKRTQELIELKKTGYRDNVEVRYIGKNGKEIWANIAASPLFGDNGNYIGTLAMVSDITEKVKLQQQLLNEQMNRQKDITKAMLEAAEKERNEIGAELHDNVNQIIAAAMLYLNYSLTISDYKPPVIKAKEFLSSATEEIKKLSKILVGPARGDKLGLISSISGLIDDITLVKDIKIGFHHEGFDEQAIEYGLRMAIFRVIQEQLNNIIQHAQSSEARIELKCENGELFLIISDNGVGFSFSTHRKGIGFQNMMNRAEAYGGYVKITSSPGRGCKLEIKFRLISPPC